MNTTESMRKAWCEYRNIEYINPLPSEDFEKGYEYGRRDALAGQWRSVEDGLPEEGEFVLIETINTIETAFWNPYHQCWDDPDGDDILYEKDKVIRWMPIPEPPKDENNV